MASRLSRKSYLTNTLEHLLGDALKFHVESTSWNRSKISHFFTSLLIPYSGYS